MKVPVKLICKIGGAVLVGVGAVMGAMESDEKVQKVIKMVASKSLETMEKKS